MTPTQTITAGPDMTNKPLTERLRASPTRDIMREAADALDEAAQKYAALLEDYKELESQLAAVGAGGVSPIMGQPPIRALLAERDALREALTAIEQWEVPFVESRGEAVPMGVAYGSNGVRDYFRDIARAALAQEQEES